MRLLLAAISLFSLALVASAQSSHEWCPTLPPAGTVSVAKPVPPTSPPGQTYLGTVVLLVAISNRGNVCAVTLASGVDEAINIDAINRVQKWRFHPAKKDNRAVEILAQLDIQYWRNRNGQIATVPASPPEKLREYVSARQ
jgi:Gram-negative bacterial TonB protein C-terminal